MAHAITIWVFPTRACNFRCAYCYEEHDSTVMSEETAEATVDWAVEQAQLAGASEILFQYFGGEPFIGLKALKRIVEYGARKTASAGISISHRANTNGSLISDEVAEFVRANQIGLDFSLDGPAYVNDRFRITKNGESAYESAGGVARVVYLKKLGVEVSVNMVVGPENVHQLYNNLNHFWSNDITSIQVLPMFDGGREWSETNLEEFDGQLHSITRHIIKMVLLDGAHDYLNFSPFSKIIDQIKLTKDAEQFADLGNHTYCGVGRNLFAIDINGDVFSCPRFIHERRIDRKSPEYKAGNIKSTNYNMDVIDRFSQWNPRTNSRSPCSECKIRLTCIYQCVGENIAWQDDEYKVLPIVCKISSITQKYGKELYRLFFDTTSTEKLVDEVK